MPVDMVTGGAAVVAVLHVTVVRALGALPRVQTAELMTLAQSMLADEEEEEEEERRWRVVLLVDEAHLLSAAQLESCGC